MTAPLLRFPGLSPLATRCLAVLGAGWTHTRDVAEEVGADRRDVERALVELYEAKRAWRAGGTWKRAAI